MVRAESNDTRAAAARTLQIGMELLGKVEEPLAKAEEVVKASGERDAANKHKVLFANLLRLACSRYQGACLLYESECIEEVAILMRSVFEIALQVAYVSIDPQVRAVEYERHGLAKLHESFEKMKPKWPDIVNRYESTDWYRAGAAAEAHPIFENRCDMAKAIDRYFQKDAMERSYRLFYPIESEIAHASAAGTMRRSGLGDFEWLLHFSVGFGVFMFVNAVEDGDGVLGLGLKDATKECNDKLRRLWKD